MGSGAGKFVVFGVLVVLALAIAGLITGALGAGLTQSEEDKATGETAEGIIPKPEIHLPAQVAFPTSDRTHYRNFLFSEEVESLLDEGSLSEHQLEELNRFLHEITSEPVEKLKASASPDQQLIDELVLEVTEGDVEELLEKLSISVDDRKRIDESLSDAGVDSLAKLLEAEATANGGAGEIGELLLEITSADVQRLIADEEVSQDDRAAIDELLLEVTVEEAVLDHRLTHEQHQHEEDAGKIVLMHLLTHEQFEVMEEFVDEGPYQGSNFIITNAILSSWIASLVLVLLFVLGARKASLVPGRFQNFIEVAIEGLLNFVVSVVGREHSRLIFPVIASIFLFVLINAWIGLLPIYPSLGFKDDDLIQIHLLRPAGTDINMPLALALVSFVFVEWLGLKMLGIGYITKFVRVGSLKQGIRSLFKLQILDAFQGLLDFFFVGPLEAFSELVRLISFTFRLFGNMTAGEILVLVSAFLVPFIATVGVYGLELLVGFIQALIFSGLTLVFAAIAITAHHAEESH